MMNWDQVEGSWKQLKGTLREQWGKLTDDDVEVIRGRREKLSGILQKRYAIAREEAERQIADFLAKVGRSVNATIAMRIESKLAAKIDLPNQAEIDIDVTDGIVTLTGRVDCEERRQHVKELALSVDGVLSVNNNLDVSNHISAGFPMTRSTVESRPGRPHDTSARR